MLSLDMALMLCSKVIVMQIRIPFGDFPKNESGEMLDEYLVRVRIVDESNNTSYWVYYPIFNVNGEWQVATFEVDATSNNRSRMV